LPFLILFLLHGEKRLQRRKGLQLAGKSVNYQISGLLAIIAGVLAIISGWIGSTGFFAVVFELIAILIPALAVILYWVLLLLTSSLPLEAPFSSLEVFLYWLTELRLAK
jgi:hypothetical protein